MALVRLILILLLALHPASMVAVRGGVVSGETVLQSPTSCGCCEGEVCACGCCDTGVCICGVPERAPWPQPEPAPAPGAASQFKALTGLPWPQRLAWTSDDHAPAAMRADPAWLVARAARTGCDSVHALFCIWTT